MCGIYFTDKFYSENQFDAKLDIIKHRGPDNSTIYKKDDLTFGHNRLSIIDTSIRANQPFDYEDITLVFNGEIYNFLELRKKLVKQGYSFKTESDTEVLAAHLVEYWDEGFHHLNGMFGLVAYSKKRRQCLIARDRYGQKPIYYQYSNEGIEVSSEIKQIKVGQQLSENVEAISNFFHLKYISTPSTCYNEVSKLEPGYLLQYNIDDKKLSKKQYYEIKFDRDVFNLSYLDARARLMQLLEDAVERRLVADVPLGIFLSGGVDSSLITALAARSKVDGLKTFSIKFEEAKFDESKYAEQVAQHFNTNHTTIPCSYAEGVEIVENLSYHFDEPFADASAIPTMLLSKHTRKHVTVALGGDAGDEVFLGYNRYMLPWQVKWMHKIPFNVRSYIGSILQNSFQNRIEAIGKLASQKTISDLYLSMASTIDTSWLTRDIRLGEGSKRYLEFGKSSERGFGAYDLKTYLPDDINVKVDRASMAFSLECRAPLMDYTVVDFGLSLNHNYCIKAGEKKFILKDILSKYIPTLNINRPKSGFTMPLESWFRSELKDFVHDHLSERNLKQIPYVDEKKVMSKIDDHMKGKSNNYVMIWKLINYKLWKERYIYNGY